MPCNLHWGRGSWNMTGEIFFQDDVKWEGVTRSNELCNHNAGNVRIGEKDWQVRIRCRWISWRDSLSGPRETTRWGLVHGASLRHQPLWVFHGWRRSSQVSSTRHSSGFRQYLHFSFLFLTKSGTDSTLPQAMSREVSSVGALPSVGLVWGYMFNNILTSVLLLLTLQWVEQWSLQNKQTNTKTNFFFIFSKMLRSQNDGAIPEQ